MGRRSINYSPDSSQALQKTVRSLNKEFSISMSLETSDFDEKMALFLIKAINSEDRTLLLKISDCYSLRSRLLSPSIRSLVNNKILTNDGVIGLIELLINDTAAFFGVNTSGSPTVISGMLIKKYDDYSLADFIVFFDQCKQRVHADNFEHISSRGITAEFLLKWIEKYDKERELEKMSILKSDYKDSTIIQISDSQQKEQFQKLVQKHKTKVKVLKKQQLLEKKEASYDKLIRYLSCYVLPFEPAYVNNRVEEIDFVKIARELVGSEKEIWKTEFMKLKQFSSNRKEDNANYKSFITSSRKKECLFDMKKVSKKQFVQLRTKEWLIRIEKKLDVNPQNLILKAINQLIIAKQIHQVEELIPYLSLKGKLLENTVIIDVETFNYWLSRKLIERFSKNYNQYLDQSIAQRAYPESKRNYILIRSKHWINKLKSRAGDLHKDNSKAS